MAKPTIGITMGDPAGVGPEVMLRALTQVGDICRPVLYAARQTLTARAEKLSLVVPTCELVDVDRLDLETITAGTPGGKLSGLAAASCLEKATEDILAGKIEAVVTGPIDKSAMAAAGFGFPGHTEYFANRASTSDFGMMFVGAKLKVILASIHLSLKSAIEQLDRERIMSVCRLAVRSLKNDFGLDHPRLGLAGLNPHAGEGGMFGTEEEQIIAPAVEALREEGLAVSGPYPPDTIFNRAVAGEFDLVVAMYHDQGLIPFKLLHFSDGVNVTIGLPFVRTSVDHGTAYDVAALGRADPTSMIEAIKLAAEIVKNRKRINGK
jgi:4-hydroxythreonine-4-phosphate dehydrogenase